MKPMLLVCFRLRYCFFPDRYSFRLGQSDKDSVNAQSVCACAVHCMLISKWNNENKIFPMESIYVMYNFRRISENKTIAVYALDEKHWISISQYNVILFNFFFLSFQANYSNIFIHLLTHRSDCNSGRLTEAITTISHLDMFSEITGKYIWPNIFWKR